MFNHEEYTNSGYNSSTHLKVGKSADDSLGPSTTSSTCT